MNNQRAVSASKNNNTQRTAQSLSVTLDHRVDVYALGASWMGRTLCTLVLDALIAWQTVHLIIFYPREIVLVRVQTHFALLRHNCSLFSENLGFLE